MKRSELHAPARGALLLAALCLAACVPAVKDLPPGDPVAWAARLADLTPRSTFTIGGRVAIATADDGFSGTLAWDQQGEVFDVSVEGPFGAGAMRIHGDAEALTMSTSKGETITVTDPERELEAKLGWPMPVRSMRYWLVGIPDPASAYEASYDGAGRPRLIVQGGWIARYETWQSKLPDSPHALPRKLTLERDDLRIRIVASEWKF